MLGHRYKVLNNVPNGWDIDTGRWYSVTRLVTTLQAVETALHELGIVTWFGTSLQRCWTALQRFMPTLYDVGPQLQWGWVSVISGFRQRYGMLK